MGPSMFGTNNFGTEATWALNVDFGNDLFFKIFAKVLVPTFTRIEPHLPGFQ